VITPGWRWAWRRAPSWADPASDGGCHRAHRRHAGNAPHQHEPAKLHELPRHASDAEPNESAHSGALRSLDPSDAGTNATCRHEQTRSRLSPAGIGGALLSRNSHPLSPLLRT
jgi:hypothetical protein